jgi:hypothetical protein
MSDDQNREQDVNSDQRHIFLAKFPFFTRTKITSMKILRLTFNNDHHLMKDNNTDWKDSGSLFSKPEWTYGNPSKPISITKNQTVNVTVDFEVNPSNADSTTADVTGTAAFGSLVFTATNQSFKGGVITVNAISNTLPDAVDKLTGDIKWNVSTKDDGPFDAGTSWGHTLYLTMGTPGNAPNRESGITQFRMDKSVTFVKSRKKAVAPWPDAPHAIVADLMTTIPGYALVPDPAVNSAVDHPQYFNNIGGAWNIFDFMTFSAECQAIVRLFRAVIFQIGCPGTATAKAVYADPNLNKGNTTLEDDLENPPAGGAGLHHVATQTINGKRCECFLVDTDPGTTPGKVFDAHQKGRIQGIGTNYFEACLVFDAPPGIKYYPGGTSGLGVRPSKEAIMAIPEFKALVWVSAAGGDQGDEYLVKVEEIVKHW